jgi:hypothetical protein
VDDSAGVRGQEEISKRPQAQSRAVEKDFRACRDRTGFSLSGFLLPDEKFKRDRLKGLLKKCSFVIPSEARGLLFFAKHKKNQIPRAHSALRND